MVRPVLLRSEISELQRTEKRGTGEDKRDKKSLRIFDELLISFNCHYEKIEDVLRWLKHEIFSNERLHDYGKSIYTGDKRFSKHFSAHSKL